MKTFIKYTYLAYAVSLLALPLNKPESSLELDASPPKHAHSDSGAEDLQEAITNFVKSDLIKGTLTSKAKNEVEDLVIKDTNKVIDYLGDKLEDALPFVVDSLKHNFLEAGLATVLAGYVAKYMGVIDE